jgi:hypothetical protein
MTLRSLVLAWALGAATHPLHTTHTEIVMQRGGQVTVTIRAFTDDLHLAVTRAAGAVTDSTLAAYVRRSLEIGPGGGPPAPLHWEGASVEGDATLLRLRAMVPGGLGGRWVRQAMHVELFRDQVNVVLARYDGRRQSFLFTPGDAPRQLP